MRKVMAWEITTSGGDTVIARPSHTDTLRWARRHGYGIKRVALLVPAGPR